MLDFCTIRVVVPARALGNAHICQQCWPAQDCPHPEERPLGRVSKDRPQASWGHPSRRRASARLLRMRVNVWLGKMCACPSAKAGLYNPWPQLLQKVFAAVPKRDDTVYGSPEFTEQVQHLLGCCGDGTMLWPAQP